MVIDERMNPKRPEPMIIEMMANRRSSELREWATEWAENGCVHRWVGSGGRDTPAAEAGPPNGAYVCGVRSPYPTVVIVVKTQYRAATYAGPTSSHVMMVDLHFSSSSGGHPSGLPPKQSGSSISASPSHVRLRPSEPGGLR